MKKELQNWKQKLQTLSWSKSVQQCGGHIDFYLIIGVIYLVIAIYNAIHIYTTGYDYFDYLIYSIPFLIAFVMLITKYKIYLDLIFDILICIVFLIISEIGVMNAVPMLYLIYYRISNPSKNIPILISFSIFLCIGGIINNWDIVRVFTTITMYLFMSIKYYYIIHKPTQELKALVHFKQSVIDDLTNKLEILGSPSLLTDDQLLNKYPWLKYSGEDVYRKIKDLRDMGNGYSNQELAYRNEVEPDTQSKNLKRIKEDIKRETGEKVLNNTHLVKICIELGIIHATIRP